MTESIHEDAFAFICPGCGQTMEHLKPAEGCLFGEYNGYVWHAGCLSALDASQQREARLRAVIEEIRAADKDACDTHCALLWKATDWADRLDQILSSPDPGGQG